jgi:hypothetical protein
MYRVASIHAYDVFETVHVSATVKLWDGLQTGSPTSEYTASATIMGVGSAEDHEWLRDALVGLIESL